jgi:hypothetical protein
MEYVAMVLGIMGGILVSFKKPYLGSWAWVFGNGIWTIYGYKTDQYGLMAQFGLFWLLAVIGVYNWRKQKW